MSSHRRSRPPGLYDVARLAGVSHQTVSRVINAHPNVAPETRRRVEEAIAQLGYRRNVAARALVTRRSNTIGVITGVSVEWGPSMALVGIEAAARDAGFFVSVAGLGSIDPSTVRDVIGHFDSQGVDGIVVIAPEGAMAHLAEPLVTDVPVVVVAAGAEPADGVKITAIDQQLGARLATAHLAEQGHTRIAHLAGPEPWVDAIERVSGWRDELRARRLRPGPLLRGDWTAASGYRLGQRLIDRGNPPTAMFVANDLMAIGFIRALYEAGVRVPHDISVVGFDDIPGVSHLIPRLTTVRQDLDRLGHQCIEILLGELSGTTSDYPLLEPILIVRDSTAPPG